MIFRKIEKLLFLIFNLFINKKNFFKKEQEKIFTRNGLNRDLGIKIYGKLVEKNSEINSEMVSEHQYIFSALSQNNNFNFNKILEIGSYDGKNALLLSKLFPNSKIKTLDLPSNTNQFKNTYKRNNYETLNKFVTSRNKLLADVKNIELLETNSINLVKEEQLYDLIWIDGAHGAPVVIIDIINALRLCNPKGLIFCDDVYVKPLQKQDANYYSNASFETLKVLESEKLIHYDLFLKRIENKYNYYPKDKKFIALIKKSELKGEKIET